MLSTFLRQHRAEVLDAWDTFARSMLDVGDSTAELTVRDHAEALIAAIADDMEQEQTEEERSRKPSGADDATRMGNVAAVHASLRFEGDFQLDELVAEYRALRASVVHLWMPTLTTVGMGELRQLTRFDEAVDQALTQSIGQYGEHLARVRDQVLGVLGHDLRNPLGAIRMSAAKLARNEQLAPDDARLVDQIARSGAKMSRMIVDLLDLTRTRLGGTLQLRAEPVDLRVLVESARDELAAYHPDRTVTVEASGRLEGAWDRDRIEQAVSNLVANALQHGDPTSPITIRVTERGDGVAIAVHNLGPVIPARARRTLFESFAGTRTRPSPTGSLGMGLYIVRQIAVAHGGSVDVTSDARSGTTFLLTLPRRPPGRRADATAPDGRAPRPPRPGTARRRPRR